MQGNPFDPVNVGNPKYGYWLPSFDALPFGTPASPTTPDNLDALSNHSYYIYSTIRPFDWYVFGFGTNFQATQLAQFTVAISSDQEEKNLSAQFIGAGGILGWTDPNPTPGSTIVQKHPHWMAMQNAYCVADDGGIWGWLGEKFGVESWAAKKNCRYVAPYKVDAGRQLRFIVQNRLTGTDVTSTILSVAGMRWMPFEGKI